MSTALGQCSSHCGLQSRLNSGDYHHFVEVPRGYLFLAEVASNLRLLYEPSVLLYIPRPIVFPCLGDLNKWEKRAEEKHRKDLSLFRLQGLRRAMRLWIIPQGLEKWKTSSEIVAALGKNENASQ